MRALGLACLAAFVWSSTAAAQQGDRLPPAPPPVSAPVATPAAAPAAAPASSVPAPVASDSAPAATAPGSEAAAAPVDVCMPGCRSGFVCVQAQCVSACNPACPAGQMCTTAGECAWQPGPPAPQFYPPQANIPHVKDPSAERHDGLMLRLAIGFGGGWARREVNLDTFELLGGDGTTKLSGGGVTLSADLGGAVVENLIIHGRLALFGLGDPKITRHDVRLGSDDKNGVGSVLVAPAITYYIMPINLYLTGAIGLAATSAMIVQEDDQDSHGAWGFGLNFDVGKEWWVNDDWGLGAAARFWYANGKNTIDHIDTKYSLTAMGVLFTATYQ